MRQAKIDFFEPQKFMEEFMSEVRVEISIAQKLMARSLHLAVSSGLAILLSLLASTAAAAIAETKVAAPSCANLQGRWKSELGTILVIERVKKDGYLSGYFISPEENGAEKFKVFGWLNETRATTNLHYMPALTFSVNWGEYGSVSSWSGGCIAKNKLPTLVMIMHLSLANSQYEWDHSITGSDRFIPEWYLLAFGVLFMSWVKIRPLKQLRLCRETLIFAISTVFRLLTSVYGGLSLNLQQTVKCINSAV